MMQRILALLIVVGSLTPHPGAAQSPCGETVTVVYLDTLAEIADRCETTISALVEANPGIENPDRIYVGQTLRIPETPRAAPEGVPGTEWAGEVQVEPERGPPGTVVRLRASGFPAGAPLNIGAGPAQSEYEILEREVEAGENGRLAATATLPESAEAGEEWRFIVETDDHRVKGRSSLFRVVNEDDAPATGAADGRTTYTVQAGDTLAGIATVHDTTVERLLSLNPHIDDPDLIFPGTDLRLPGDA